jgi:hypothetical protein
MYKCNAHESQERKRQREQDNHCQDPRPVLSYRVHQPFAGLTALLKMVSQLATGNGPCPVILIARGGRVLVVPVTFVVIIICILFFVFFRIVLSREVEVVRVEAAA